MDDSAIRAKVTWGDLTMPKQKGGLGIRKLEKWNSDCILRNFWCLIMQFGSLWVM